MQLGELDAFHLISNGVSAIIGSVVSGGVLYMALRERLRSLFATRGELERVETDAVSRRKELRKVIDGVGERVSSVTLMQEEHLERIATTEEAQRSCQARLRTEIFEPIRELRTRTNEIAEGQAEMKGTLRMIEQLVRNGGH